MSIRIRLVDGSKKWDVDVSGEKTVREVLSMIGLISEEYIVSLNGRIVSPDEKVRNGDELVLYPVVSGG